MELQHPNEAQTEIMTRLTEHFARSGDFVNVEQLGEMTGLGQPAITGALRVLAKAGWVEGPELAEYDYPSVITGIRYS